MNQALKQLIIDIFPEKQREILIKVLEGNYNLVDTKKNRSEYENYLRVRKKLKHFKQLMAFDEIQDLLSKRLE